MKKEFNSIIRTLEHEMREIWGEVKKVKKKIHKIRYKYMFGGSKNVSYCSTMCGLYTKYSISNNWKIVTCKNCLKIRR